MLKCLLFYNNQSCYESLVGFFNDAVLFSSPASICEHLRLGVSLPGSVKQRHSI